MPSSYEREETGLEKKMGNL